MMAYEVNKVSGRLDRLAVAGIGINAENGVATRLSIFANLVFLAAGIAGVRALGATSARASCSARCLVQARTR